MKSLSYLLFASIFYICRTSLGFDGCAVTDEGAKFMCSAFDALTPDQPKELQEQICNCATAFFIGDNKNCNPDNYDFPTNPSCGKLFKSKNFRDFVELSRQSLANKVVVKFVGEAFGICADIIHIEKDMILNLMRIFFKSEMLLAGFDNVLNIGVDADTAKLFSNCAREYGALTK